MKSLCCDDNVESTLLIRIYLMDLKKLTLRTPNESELLLIRKLMEAGGLKENDLSELKVSDIDDGNMGSLLLFLNGRYEERETSNFISEYEFDDEDGIPVLASLYSDHSGVISELDIWKVNYQPLIRIPSNL